MTDNAKRFCIYATVALIIIGSSYLYFTKNYDEYGLLDKYYIGSVADCTDCIIIETIDSQYGYFFNLFTDIDNTHKTYYFRDEHKLTNPQMIKYSGIEYPNLIIKIHWSNGVIRGVEAVGLMH